MDYGNANMRAAIVKVLWSHKMHCYVIWLIALLLAYACSSPFGRQNEESLARSLALQHLADISYLYQVIGIFSAFQYPHDK